MSKPLKTPLTRKNFWSIALNSTAAFVLAFFFVFFINHFAKVFACGVFGYSIVFTHDTITYLIQSYEWTHDSVRLIYTAGPLLVFVLGLIALMIYYTFTEEEGRMKIFFLWVTMHSFNFVFSGLSIGNIFTHEIGHVFNWMYLKDTTRMIISLVGFFGLILTGLIVTIPFLLSGNAYFNKLNHGNMPFFTFAQIVVPYIIGSIIGVAFFLPQIPVQEQYSWVVLGILLTIVCVRLNLNEGRDFDMEEKKVGVSWVAVIFTFFIVLVLRFGLNNGITINW